tara:strand:- start:446 stop:589 length:144 start_codon:yes stop_codon:yes gene_type:complete
MLKIILFTLALNNPEFILPNNAIVQVEARSRKGKKNRGRKRGGNGLR